MINRHKNIEVTDFSEGYNSECILSINGSSELYKEAIFFDLEHYVYKKPICIGVFGACYYDSEKNELIFQQYMIENKEDAYKILRLSVEYFREMHEKYNKKYIITFSGNNDFTMIKYLLKKYNIEYDFDEYFTQIDLQKQYEKIKGKNIGLKALEKEAGILRESELISGSSLAKTISKIVKDNEYFKRMPQEKIEKILLYNEQDVVNLFHIYVNLGKFMGVKI